jgi:flavin-dependent thymidylate synthase
LKVTLAGFNTDREHGTLTPETISAAYARISRDPRPVDELRADAAREVEKARSSNRTIIFEYGHGSVAEHAVFNFDILGLSRLATEAIQSFRLASFTEKSQRYTRIGEDWFMPGDLSPDSRTIYRDTVSRLFELYDSAFSKLRESGMPLETAKEDARYVLPLATTSQMGMTANARELEHMFRRLSAHPLEEVRELGRLLMREASAVAPSLFLFTDHTEMDRFALALPAVCPGKTDPVTLTESDDDSRVGIHLVQTEEGVSLGIAKEMWSFLGQSGREDLFDSIYSVLGIHDPVPRCWEMFRAGFEVVLSATAYAQLKRHRMSTQLVSRYDPVLGYSTPPSFETARITGLLCEAVTLSEEAWAHSPGNWGAYLLTNAHRRRVTLQMNGRELYHFSRLREDCHAQWDIRSLANKMMDLVRSAAPLSMKLAGGKSETDLPGSEIK